MGSCSTTGSSSSTHFALANTAMQRGRLHGIGTGLTSGAILDSVEESTDALESSRSAFGFTTNSKMGATITRCTAPRLGCQTPIELQPDPNALRWHNENRFLG